MTQLVVVDIGGTHARFAIATISSAGAITLGEPATLHTADHASFQTAWEAFRARNGGTLPRAVSMAIAGPVGGEVIRFTNNPWIIRPALITAKLDVDRFTLVNDFAAVAHAVARADDSQFLHLAGPDEPLRPSGTISVIGPGTGLGVAHVWRDGAAYRVQATEGGHIDFAPLDSIEDAILARLRKRHNRVSVERVVAGPGIVDIYQTLAAIEGRAVPERDAIEIWTAGQDGSDSLAAAAVDRFCLSLGSVAGDITLAQGGFAGVVIAGGLGYRIRETLRTSGFAQRFRAKGRFESLMASIPVKLIVHPQPGLFGAAAAFAEEHGVSP
ncbi:glucokinase [Erythrobacter sp. T5W1-R]|uniref:glucokinase n=1 Tax=Erythrobacter sp. T5W1-R TaxID=3101752 RepID=UPI002AFF42FF|nr:glucokinase [Erythrobacter sp. T5W1-R]MEA1619361.1 glucokinase [Erythrobacter sp. T5W1-R]